MTDQIYVATDNGTVNLDGQNIQIRKGVTRVRAGHPLLAGREHLFEPLHVHYDVEQATAAPGERRGGRGRTKPTKDDDGDDGDTT